MAKERVDDQVEDGVEDRFEEAAEDASASPDAVAGGEKKVATKGQFLKLASRLYRIEEFYIPEIDMVVKIAPARLPDYHRILGELGDVGMNPEQAAEWSVAWIVACMVEPKITPEDALKLLDARTPTIARLADRCATLSGFGVDVEEAARSYNEVEGEEPGEGTPLE